MALPGSAFQEAEGAVGPAGAAGSDSLGESAPGFIQADAAGALARIPAVAAVDLGGRAVPVQALLEQPLGREGPVLDAPLSLRLPLLRQGDRRPDLPEEEHQVGLQGAESGQVRRQVGHASSLPHNSNKVSTGGMANHRVEYLTPRQEQLLRHIRLAITDQGDAPTVAEIAAAVGLRPSSVHYQLRELEAKGAISREPGRPRGIWLT